MNAHYYRDQLDHMLMDALTQYINNQFDGSSEHDVEDPELGFTEYQKRLIRKAIDLLREVRDQVEPMAEG